MSAKLVSAPACYAAIAAKARATCYAISSLLPVLIISSISISSLKCLFVSYQRTDRAYNCSSDGSSSDGGSQSECAGCAYSRHVGEFSKLQFPAYDHHGFAEDRVKSLK